MKINEKYFVKTKTKPSKPGCWDIMNVDIFMNDENGSEIQIGSYERNYTTLYKTFIPFTKNGKDYALYSRDYTATRVMSLPDCIDIGGEEPDAIGFCPVEYFVPAYDDFEDKICNYEKSEDDNKKILNEKVIGHFGFIAGCIWGDDSSWKVQYLDLSNIENGIIKRDNSLLGYSALLPNKSLKDSIVIESYDEEDNEILFYASSTNVYQVSLNADDLQQQKEFYLFNKALGPLHDLELYYIDRDKEKVSEIRRICKELFNLKKGQKNDCSK